MAYRAIIISLHPEWWREIRLGAKLLEIRKTRPRGNGPYTVLVYVTGGVGVVGEFVCDCFYKLDTVPGLPTWALPPQESGTPYNLERASCLTRRQLEEYAGGSGKPLWGWHISHVREYERWFSYGTQLERDLLLQIFYKVTGDASHYEYTGPYKRRKKAGVNCTAVEAAEIELLFNFYKEKMKEELEVFMLAFKQKNNLYPDGTERAYKEYDGPERELTKEELRRYKKAAFMRTSMDSYTPPKAAIEEREVAANE